MKISLNWLRDFVDISAADEKLLIDKLTVTTSELEGVEYKGLSHEKVVIGQIKEVKKHPDSTKLHLLKVDIKSEVLDIVCGAPNVAVDLKVPVVLVGGMVSGMKIKQAKVAGFISNGMCCGGEELGIESKSDGLLILPESAQVGADAIEFLALKDTVLDIDNKSLTNRPDLWGHYGFAREVAAILNKPLKHLEVEDLKKYKNLPSLDIKVKSDDVLRYSALKIENISKKESSALIKTRLTYCGLKPINFLADLTNYVMLETSQPLHAFDGKKLNGVVVKNLEKDTKFVTLDKHEHILRQGTLSICDKDESPIAVAGVMGGLDSEIVENTDSVLLESACFKARTIRISAASIGTRTDASNRYEKSLDPENCSLATARYLKLLKTECPDAKVTSNFTDIYSFKYPALTIKLTHKKIEKYLGQSISAAVVKDILKRLGFTVKDNIYNVLVPSFRATKDITIEADLIEEVARMYGYNNIIPKPYQTEVKPIVENRFSEDIYNLKEILATGHGFNEVNSYVYKNKNFTKEFKLPDTNNVKILGALSPEHSELRNNLAYTLINFGFENIKNFDDIKIFEIASCFNNLDENKLVIEKKHLSLVVCSRTKSEENLYRYMAKTISQAIKSLKNIDISFEKNANNIANPNMSNDILYNGIILGHIASLNPKITLQADKKLTLSYAEIDMEKLSSINLLNTKLENISKYPAVEIDISFLVKKDMPYKTILDAIFSQKYKILQNTKLVEVYQDKTLGEKKSVTVRFVLCSDNKTLTTDDIKNFSDNMTKQLLKFDITPRY